jgi:hypothetical protein
MRDESLYRGILLETLEGLVYGTTLFMGVPSDLGKLAIVYFKT